MAAEASREDFTKLRLETVRFTAFTAASSALLMQGVKSEMAAAGEGVQDRKKSVRHPQAAVIRRKTVAPPGYWLLNR